VSSDASALPARPTFLVCEECHEPASGTTIGGITQPCGHLAESVRVCLTFATADECRCPTAFHDTMRATSSRIPWLAVLVERHIKEARGE
jgi:hypothetical protein